jgi:hypothetical protein
MARAKFRTIIPKLLPRRCSMMPSKLPRVKWRKMSKVPSMMRLRSLKQADLPGLRPDQR